MKLRTGKKTDLANMNMNMDLNRELMSKIKNNILTGKTNEGKIIVINQSFSESFRERKIIQCADFNGILGFLENPYIHVETFTEFNSIITMSLQYIELLRKKYVSIEDSIYGYLTQITYINFVYTFILDHVFLAQKFMDGSNGFERFRTVIFDKINQLTTEIFKMQHSFIYGGNIVFDDNINMDIAYVIVFLRDFNILFDNKIISKHYQNNNVNNDVNNDVNNYDNINDDVVIINL